MFEKVGNKLVRTPTTSCEIGPSDGVFAADATLSIGENQSDRTRNLYTRVLDLDSPHMQGRVPAGGNLLYVDSHVTWQKFAKMMVRTSPNSSAVPAFCW